jgi:hypothetical protein
MIYLQICSKVPKLSYLGEAFLGMYLLKVEEDWKVDPANGHHLGYMYSVVNIATLAVPVGRCQCLAKVW